MAAQHLHGHHHRHLHGHGHRSSPLVVPMEVREPVSLPRSEDLVARAVEKRATLTRLFARDCDPTNPAVNCEKPINLTVPITVSVVVPVIIAICVLIYLHRRTAKRHKKEDQDLKYKSMDFGLVESSLGKNKRKSKRFGGEKIKPLGTHTKQLSMDMNLSSPYLLPPELHQSRESLNSLAKGLHQHEDPYRLIGLATDNGSIRSFSRGPGDSPALTGHTLINGERDGSKSPLARAVGSPDRVNSSTSPERRSPLSEGVAVPPPVAPAKNEFRFTDDGVSPPRVAPAAYTAEETVDMPNMPEITEPQPVARKDVPAAPASHARPVSDESISGNHTYVGGLLYDHERESGALPSLALNFHSDDGLGIMDGIRAQSPIARKDPTKVLSTGSSIYQDYSDGFQFNIEDPGHSDTQNGPVVHDEHMRPEHEYPLSAGLGVPQQANKRLSVGFRPLPPDDFLESDDPEFRANRIRSFYKEYFDDGKEERPPMPQPMKAEYVEDYDPGFNAGQANHQAPAIAAAPAFSQARGFGQGYGNHGGHHDAYNDGYYDDGGADLPYYDPDTNAFVMPYAQPVTRRAMTPPPRNRMPMPGPRQRPPRGPGGPGPRAHGPQGSFGGMSTQSGSRGRPRAGSAMSGPWGAGTPRPGSSASGFRGKPRKPMPPPAPLTTLPTPSKLKDDSFAIMGAIDFAPPSTYRDQAAGRSQSPLGERRPYARNVPVSSPLISAFDDMPALPSPHLLRKSSTFTGLDFAPPRRFKDPDSMSDAGSVRSMGSGISSKNLGAIRNGAGRVSRLPGDQVFSQAEMTNTLKPAWSMRD